MPTVYLNIGSNKGDRHALIEQAVALISSYWPQARMRLSDWIESAPWGYDSKNKFLNIGVAVDFDTMPRADAILDGAQAIERRISDTPHRNADGTYCDRCIDIDIIAIDKTRLSSPRLILPHPRAHLREFVIKPLEQLAPPDLVYWLKKSAEHAHDAL